MNKKYDPMVEAAQAMRNLGMSQEEIDDYIRQMNEGAGNGLPVTTTRTIDTFDIKTEEGPKEIKIGSSMASSLDMPIPASQMLKELQTQKALERAIEARQKGVSEFDLAKGEKKR